jgi:sugar lactone lactonase YvrE
MADIAINEQAEVFLSGGDSLPEKPTYVHFGPDGQRVGTKQFALDNIKERWYPLPVHDRTLVVGYHDAFIVDADGKVQRKIQRRPDGMWLEHPDSASVAPDGTFAIVSGGSLRWTHFFVNLYSADGDPIRTVVLPDSCMAHCFAYTGKYLATCTESAICLFTPTGEPVLSFEYPLEKLKEHWWTCYSTKGGRELWMVSSGLKKVCRFGLP